MSIFSRIKQGISNRANAALDAAIDPAKELDLAILELEDGRKKALAELVSYKETAKRMSLDVDKYRAKAQEWEQRAMLAVRAGDDDAAKLALREKKQCELEAAKIAKDQAEAQSYAVALNKSRKEFETKLTMLKLRKGTLATQLAAAKGKGDVMSATGDAWERFAQAEARIDDAAIAAEVDAALRGEASGAETEARFVALERGAGAQAATGTPLDPLAALKAKMQPPALALSEPAAGASEPASPSAAEGGPVSAPAGVAKGQR